MSENVVYSQRQDRQYLHERTAGITEDLREILSPSLGRLATAVSRYDSEFYAQRESYRDFFVGRYVPYRFASIPPDFFGDEQPHNFETEEELDTCLADYWRRDDSRKEHDYEPEPVWTERARKAVTTDIKRLLLEPSAPVNFSEWNEYNQMGMYLGERSAMLNCFFTANVYPQAAESKFFDYFTDQSEAGLVTKSILVSSATTSVTAIYRSPILQNDRTLTNRLLNAGLHAATIASNDVYALHDFNDLLEHDENRALFHNHVQRTSKMGKTFHSGFGPQRLAHMAAESFMTVSSAFALLAREKPDGYPYDGYRLIDDIAEQDIIDKFTRMVPFGFIGPAMLFGRYIPDLLYATKGDQGEYRLRFNSKAITALTEFGNHVQANFARQWREYDEQSVNDPTLSPPVQTGGRCPFSGKLKDGYYPIEPTPSVVSKYSNTVAGIFRAISAE